MASPVVNTIPLAIGKVALAFVKYPILPNGVVANPGTPLIVIFDATTPAPNKTLFTNCCGVCVGDTFIGCAKLKNENKKQKI
jgi:hypothetical protein